MYIAVQSTKAGSDQGLQIVTQGVSSKHSVLWEREVGEKGRWSTCFFLLGQPAFSFWVIAYCCFFSFKNNFFLGNHCFGRSSFKIAEHLFPQEGLRENNS